MKLHHSKYDDTLTWRRGRPLPGRVAGLAVAPGGFAAPGLATEPAIAHDYDLVGAPHAMVAAHSQYPRRRRGSDYSETKRVNATGRIFDRLRRPTTL